LLKPAGKLVIQVITIPDQSYENYRRTTDWIQKYIFPGGDLPSITALVDVVTRKTSLLMENLEDIGTHYARTLKDWRESFTRNMGDISALGFDELFRRKWIYYLAMCEAGFRERALGDIQVVFRKPV
jgi:cyclopropane-fatty-acyl-phospholipid synthase